MSTLTEIPSIGAIEDYLLSLVSRTEGKTIEELRREEEAFPGDPPWDSEQFTRYLGEIEDHFGLEFDPIEVERHSRTLRKLALHIYGLVAAKLSGTA